MGIIRERIERIFGGKKDPSNALIEGIRGQKAYLMLTRMEVPESTGIIKDGKSIYTFYGKTDADFKTIEKTNTLSGELELKLSSCRDVVLDRPRAIVLKDGRIYTDKSLQDGVNGISPYGIKDYDAFINGLVKEASKFFRNRFF